jgi:glutamate synthase domain-containing protein 3
MVALEAVDDIDDMALLKRLIQRHARYTGSSRAQRLLAAWSTAVTHFTRVMPTEYKRALESQGARHGDHIRSAMGHDRSRELRQWA